MQLRKRSKSTSSNLAKNTNQHIQIKKIQKRKPKWIESNIDDTNFGIKYEKDTRKKTVGQLTIKQNGESASYNLNDTAILSGSKVKSGFDPKKIHDRGSQTVEELIHIESHSTSVKIPSILEHLNLDQTTLAFLESLPPPPNIEVPALPPLKGSLKTLVLDLDETLVHCSLKCLGGSQHEVMFCLPEVGNTTVYVKVRPYVNEFLRYAASLFELVVFTASNAIYANKIIDLIDPEKTLFQHRMFRHHCHLHKKMYVKDLRALGRDMSQVVILDNSVEAFGFQLENGILCNTWLGCPTDKELNNLMCFLKTIHTARDVRDAVTQFYSVCDF